MNLFFRYILLFKKKTENIKSNNLKKIYNFQKVNHENTFNFINYTLINL